MKTLIALLVVVVATFIIVPQVAFTVDQTQHVLVTRFGEVQRSISAPGLNFKAPFIDTAVRLDKRLLRVDVDARGFPDVENQFLVIDAYVRYRITNPRSFRETLVNEAQAASRISDIVTSQLRAEVGQRTRPQIIGGQITVGADGVTRVEPILEGDVAAREALTRLVRERVDTRVKTQGFGIEIVDVRIKRADFPDTILENVYARMRTEREVQAQKLRAEGEETYLTITADVDRQVQVIWAEAEETSDRLRGEGEAEAIRILAVSLERDPEFFAFRRSLEAYKVIIGSDDALILKPDNELFRYLQGGALPTP